MPAAISNQVIATLRAREDASGFIHLDRRPNFHVGDKIRVVHGVFSDCLGLYEGMKDSGSK
jgi:transcription antitermination factor NusG